MDRNTPLYISNKLTNPLINEKCAAFGALTEVLKPNALRLSSRLQFWGKMRCGCLTAGQVGGMSSEVTPCLPSKLAKDGKNPKSVSARKKEIFIFILTLRKYET